MQELIYYDLVNLVVLKITQMTIKNNTRMKLKKNEITNLHMKLKEKKLYYLYKQSSNCIKLF
jgi:hypothetical protein